MGLSASKKVLAIHEDGSFHISPVSGKGKTQAHKSIRRIVRDDRTKGLESTSLSWCKVPHETLVKVIFFVRGEFCRSTVKKIFPHRLTVNLSSEEETVCICWAPEASAWEASKRCMQALIKIPAAEKVLVKLQDGSMHELVKGQQEITPVKPPTGPALAITSVQAVDKFMQINGTLESNSLHKATVFVDIHDSYVVTLKDPCGTKKCHAAAIVETPPGEKAVTSATGQAVLRHLSPVKRCVAVCEKQHPRTRFTPRAIYVVVTHAAPRFGLGGFDYPELVEYKLTGAERASLDAAIRAV